MMCVPLFGVVFCCLPPDFDTQLPARVGNEGYQSNRKILIDWMT